MALEQWALPQLRDLLPLDDGELKQIISYSNGLSDSEATKHLENLLGESPDATAFIGSYVDFRSGLGTEQPPKDSKPPLASNKQGSYGNTSVDPVNSSKGGDQKFQPPSGPPPAYAGRSTRPHHTHTNDVIEAGRVRARDEQEMQQALQDLRFRYRIYNDDIDPEHDTEYYCNCPIHQYQWRKFRRYGVQDMWSKAVMYPGEKAYNENIGGRQFVSRNPYQWRVISPYGLAASSTWGPQTPIPRCHAQAIHQTIALNNQLNQEAQRSIDAKEPKHNIWENDTLETAMASLGVGDRSTTAVEKPGLEPKPSNDSTTSERRSSKFSGFRKAIGIKSSEERAINKAEKAFSHANSLRDAILAEEMGRWPDEQSRGIAAQYLEKVGMAGKIADLRNRCPLQYFHLLKAGYFEPIPVAWAEQASNPLKFSVEAASGWRGITPAWRGYEDLAEERLYWVLNHREGSVGMRMKPDFISEMNMARARMATAVEPPPLYFSADDTCNVQHIGNGYSKQVMPPPFRPVDQPESPNDDTMILLDVSGSMDFDPVRPIYEQYLITRYTNSPQPKNKDVARAVIRRFTDAMSNHDHMFQGYDLVTFSNHSRHIGKIKHDNLDQKWSNVHFGGGTRVMTGWQKVKELHFQKHSESAIHHPVWGWQAGPSTPILRLLLLLDGEATDMDEFELDLLGLSWAHVTIFLIGVDGCPHHHRHANELQRISDVNHHVSFVDAQGNCPERFVTHELLKRHLGYNVTMEEFQQMEELPPYTE